MHENKNDLRVELWIKAEQCKQSLLSNDNYDILTRIITDSRFDHLKSMHGLLLKTMDTLQSFYQLSNGDKSSINYKKYRYNSTLVNLRLNILYCKMRHRSVETYMHRYAGMSYLLSRGYNPEYIVCLIDAREGKPDYFTTVDAKGYEIKFLDRNVIYFTRLQFINFSEDVNVVIFERIRHDVYLDELVNIGYRYRKTLKFGDIINRKEYLPYKIMVKDSDFKSALIERSRILADRKKQTNIEDAWL